MRKPGNRFIRFGAVAISAGLMLGTLPSSPALASSGATTVSAGADYSCVLTANGAQCTGNNREGEFGDGTLISRKAPAVVPGTLPFSAISAGGTHTCALTTSAGLKCWGFNGSGELGNNTTTSSAVPVDVSGLTSGAAAVSAGESHTCGLTTTGGAKCWGFNAFGQLGDNSTTSRKIPVDVSGLTSGVAKVSAGGNHSCAVTTTGGAKCWGFNAFGVLGDNTNTNRKIPVNVFGLTSGVAAISAGGTHTCALTTTGGVKCWGDNAAGELGNGSNINSKIPVDVTGLTSGVAAVSAGTDHTCALTTTGGVKCWGSDVSGELGDGTNTDSNVPVDVSGLTSGVTAVSAGTDHTCALAALGALKCWGSNASGQLGDGTITDSNVPVDTLGFTVTRISLRLGKSTVSQGNLLKFVMVAKTGTPPKPAGTVEVYVDNSFLGSGVLTNGKLTVKFAMTMALGPHTVRAIYDGQGSLSSSRSVARTVTVVP